MTTESTFPALRARMGEWWYYCALMTFGDVAKWITRTDQIHSNARLREWIQRELQLERIDEIAAYLVGQKQHFFNSLIVGIHEGDPEWYPVEVHDSVVVGKPNLDDTARESIGLLRLKGGEKVFAIDGQHRVAGILRAIEQAPSLASEQLSVLFVAHYSTPEGREKTRRLFSTVNRNAKPVSKGEIVALDEDDKFAIVTRRLVEEFEPLKDHRVAFRREAAVKSSDQSAFTTILGLYDIVITLAVEQVGIGTKGLRQLTARRPPDPELQALYDQQVDFWTCLQDAVPAVKETLTATEQATAAAKYRTAAGGNLLFRPAGQRAFCRAVRVLLNRGWTMQKAVKALAVIPTELDSELWGDVLWDVTAKLMIAKNSALAQNLYLHMIGEAPEPPTFDLVGKYRSATGRVKLPAGAKSASKKPTKDKRAMRTKR